MDLGNLKGWIMIDAAKIFSGDATWYLSKSKSFIYFLLVKKTLSQKDLQLVVEVDLALTLSVSP